MRRLLTLSLLVIASLAAAGPAASVPGPPPPPDRGIYRILPSKGADFRGLLALGLDLAGHGPGTSLDFILSPEEAERVRALGFAPIPLGVRSGSLAPESPLARPDLGDYHTYAEAVAEMAAYAAAHPAIAQLDTIGFSLEGRALVAIKISDAVATDETEPEAVVVGCHHARELMSVELPLYLMRRLLDGYGADPILTALVDSREIWIVPILNPDGYVFVENNSNGQSDGWWRKNRRLNADGSRGVDLNRNYGHLWGFDNFGSSPTPASETYRGNGPFSEPETAAFRDFLGSRTFVTSLSFHSYGGLVLYPWGYDRLDTPDHPTFFALGDSMARQNGYRAGNPKSNAIYITNGDLDDWVYGNTSIKPRIFGYTFEVNTAEQGGFAPADALIGPTCALNWGPMLTLLRFSDAPARVLPPKRPAAPRIVAGPALAWSASAIDPVNLPVRHDVRRIDQIARVTDDAESGPADWDTLRIAWSSARHASGARSYATGSDDARESILASRALLDVSSGDSLVVQAWWALEDGYDYWYAQASSDGGGTWSALPGTFTTNLNPSGQNEGFGVTGSSGGLFRRAAFSLQAFAGSQVRVRFRCVTDAAFHEEGLYLDDLTPTPRDVGVTVTDTGSPDSTYALSPPPAFAVWLQVRAVDGEGHASLWSDRVLYDPAVTGVAATPASAAPVDRIEGIAPNPMNPRTVVRFVLAAGAPGPYRLDAFDPAGRWVARVASGRDDGRGGPRSVSWDGKNAIGRDLGSGVYFLRLTHAGGSRAVKVTLLR